MPITFDKPKATQTARNLSAHLKDAHGLQLGHQQAMTALAAALGFNSLHEFSQLMKTAPSAGQAPTDARPQAPAPGLSSLCEEAIVTDLRARGSCVCAINADDAAEMVADDAAQVPSETRQDWFDRNRSVLEEALYDKARELLGMYHDEDGCPLDHADPEPTNTDPADDLPDNQIANADYGKEKSWFDHQLASMAIDQCTHRDILLEKRGDSWVWYMPASKNPQKQAPSRSYPSEGEAALAACAAFGIDPTIHCVLNHYHCEDCDKDWEGSWFCGVDEECPSCSCDCEPAESHSLVIQEDN
ncbi:hypothetical protein CKO28_00395 [Rhodovibrio sodomensis]|uniref:Uncharacterized protein n=1 Tax=Rhodovibrio sodomensis TaxID=1088 RepID=A0ABS1D903_9PROT|nr:hypothetical protein [Rhodovibrio sodomensis]MBK1666499.1 hypothetical protein [Rhodovibrio sodomensis]